MPLSVGDRLGPYEILARIGAGGMGEVYKARDTRLDRVVAIKLSKAEFSERFEREARTIATLNHPHICTLHDVGPNYLVMEYIEGTPLKGPLSLDQALKYAVQICDALDAAHKKNITHRDLKPANILVTKSGVKLLDFGLAKIGPAIKADDATMTMALTGKGEILGTLFYMSPEQLQGQDADARSDIFAFGLVLYEMLTGKRAFDGSSQASVIAAILERPAPSVAEVAPAALDRALRKCLAKDADDRWQTARDLRDEIEWIGDGAPEPKTAAPSRLGIAGWMVAALALASAGALALVHFRDTPPSLPAYTFTVAPPEGEKFRGVPAISPDGKLLAVGTLGADSSPRVAILDLQSQSWRHLPGAAGGGAASWSPDGRYLAFIADAKLKKIDIAGGPPQVLCDTPAGWAPNVAWTDDGGILFSALDGMRRVLASGGEPVLVTTLNGSRQEDMLAVPQWIPGERRFLYIARSLQNTKSGIFIASTDLPPSRQGRDPVQRPAVNAVVYAPSPRGSGFVLYARDGALMAQPIDTRVGHLTGEPFLVAPQVGFSGAALAASASKNGVLAYSTDPEATARVQFAWFDRAGKRLVSVGPAGAYTEFSLAPDEKRLAVVQLGSITGKRDIYIVDLTQAGVSTRFTFDPTSTHFPVWSPDGGRIIYADRLLGAGAINQKPANGGTTQVLGQSLGQPTDWSSDGHKILYRADNNLWVLDGGRPVRITQADGAKDQGRFSPDGKWIAYRSAESGENEIWVQPYPPSGAKWQISAGGGSEPRWSRDGKELFYLSGQALMAVPVSAATGFGRGPAKPLFRLQNVRPNVGFAPSRDGLRFLIPTFASEGTPPTITVMTNWLVAEKK